MEGLVQMVWAEQKLDPNITALQYPLRVTGNVASEQHLETHSCGRINWQSHKSTDLGRVQEGRKNKCRSRQQ